MLFRSHSRVLAEGNTNYGENLVLWDQVFGTYYNPPRPSSTDIGITGRVASSFWGQVVQPFSTRGYRQIIGRKPKELQAETIPGSSSEALPSLLMPTAQTRTE